MHIVVTGAGGFVGRRLCRALIERGGFEQLTLVDIEAVDLAAPSVRCLRGEVGDPSLRQAALADGVDKLFHLASVPGGTSESQPDLSRRVNLEASLDLFEAVAAKQQDSRIIYASSIAVFGSRLPPLIDDSTPASPTLTYGTHKGMCELALADLTRRGSLTGLSLRLPGLLARPHAANGLKSAFMSDIFHTFLARKPYSCPTTQQATVWATSVDCCIENLIHAAEIKLPRSSQVVNLPALRFSMEDLVNEISKQVGQPADLIQFMPDEALEAQFARMPQLHTPYADGLGFHHDGDLTELVRRVISRLRAD